jgi:hypothetical protein
VKTLSLAQLANRAVVAGANAGDKIQVSLHLVNVDPGSQSHQTINIQLYARLEYTLRPTIENDSHVDKLFSLNARRNAHNCIVK